MSAAWWVVLVVGPFLALVVLLGTVAIVALCRARQEDIPAVLSHFTRGFGQLARRVPAARFPAGSQQSDTGAMIKAEQSADQQGGLA